MSQCKKFEVIIIGGSYAGLSAAMALGRSLRKVLIIDSGMPCNRQTPHSHNFLTRDGQTPKEVSSMAKQEVGKYDTIQFYDGLASNAGKTGDGFEVETGSGERFVAQKLIFATGIKDQIPDIPGFSACWGISVIHCPYCHGYEYRHRQTGILANGDEAMHLAQMVSNLTQKLTIFTNSPSRLTAAQTEILNRRNIRVLEGNVLAIAHDEGHIRKITFSDGSIAALDALYAPLQFVQHCNIPVSLGCELTERGHLKTDMFQKTTVNGIFACGDNAGLMRSIASAVATGNMAGAMANSEFCSEAFL